MCHGDVMDCIADGRTNAASYMKSLAPAYPERQEQLKSVAAFFEKVSRTVGKMTEALGGWQRGENEMRMFAKQEVRKQIAEIIYEAKNADEKALEIIKELITVL